MHAEKLTCKLIDHILSQSSSELEFIACEVKALDFSRRIDLLCMDRDGLSAFEIKSEKDSINRLPGQLIDMEKCANKTFVVCASNHLRKVRHIASPHVGLIEISGNRIRHLRKPKSKVMLRKANMISCFKINEMIKYFSLSNLKYKNRIELSEYISKVSSLNDITFAFRQMLKDRHKSQYMEFLRERGEITLIDDLQILSRKEENRFRLETL